MNEPIPADASADLPRDVDVLVVGAGQAGLGVAQRLRDHPHLRVLVLDAQPVGQSWRERWDSLQLFTPRRFSALPGLRFPPGPTRSPSRLEMADYLERYATRFALPVRTGVQVRRLSRAPAGFCAHTSQGVVHARQVVLATGPFRLPFVPEASRGLDPGVVQLHSSAYQRPSDVPAGRVLVVGGGNSAAQLALELAETHDVSVASPGPPWFLPEDVLGISMYWWTLLTGVLNARADAWVSRYVRRRGDAIVGTQLHALVRQGRVRLLPHRVVVGARPRGRARRRDRPAGLDGAVVHRVPARHVAGSTSPAPSTRGAARCTTRAPRPSRGCTGWGCRGRRG